MVNAPPTPPPTTATELQDQSRSQPQAPSSNPTNPPSSSTQDSFPATFPLIVDLASKTQYRELVVKAEETDVLVRRQSAHLTERLISRI
jgi:COP9 signalosome complex subunit 8